ncbi:MAG: alpha/beta hydrolase [Verrucomicrobia bacterium]|nr:alpha/beta hydrolase [Verrucomicrobiota bacterium]
MKSLFTRFCVITLTVLALPIAAAEKKSSAPAVFERPEKGNGSVRLIADPVKPESRLFKTTPQGELKLHFFFPPGWKATDKRPAIVFFFGGGWRSGSAVQFIPQAEYFASRGLVCASADYRISSIHKTTPDVCVEDAKSAVRWVRAHAGELGVNPDRLISSGGSAGGHLAAAVALVPGFDAAGEDLKISAVPNAMVLFNPALNLSAIPTKNAAGEEIGAKISPTLFMSKGAPPAILFFGTADKLKEHGDEFLKKSRESGNRCEQWTAAGQAHGFFNKQPWTSATAIQADKFLASLGYLKGAPTLALPAGAELRDEK